VHVLRHNHVSQDAELMPAPHFIEYLNEAIPCSWLSKKWPAPITTEGHKVEITQSVVTPQRVAHRRKPRTLKTEGCGTHVSYP
jgi:hypothetical protein